MNKKISPLSVLICVILAVVMLVGVLFFFLDKIDSAPPYALEFISSSVELDVDQVYVVNSGEYKDIVSDTSVYVEGFSPELTEARFFYSDENGDTFEVKKNDEQNFTKEDIKNWNNLLEQYETIVVDNKSLVTEFKEGRRRGIIELYVLFVIIISVIPVCLYCLLNKKNK